MGLISILSGWAAAAVEVGGLERVSTDGGVRASRTQTDVCEAAGTERSCRSPAFGEGEREGSATLAPPPRRVAAPL